MKARYNTYIDADDKQHKYLMNSDSDTPELRRKKSITDKRMRTCQIDSCYYYDDCIKVPVKGKGAKCIKYKHKLHL